METLAVNAAGVVTEWLDNAVAAIDEKFGQGFAHANPALVGGFVTACATQLLGSRVQDEVVGELRAIADKLSDIVAAISNHE